MKVLRVVEELVSGSVKKAFRVLSFKVVNFAS